MSLGYRVATLAAALLLGASVASGGGSAPLSPLSLLPPPKGSRFGGAGDIEGSYDVFFGRFDEKAFIAKAAASSGQPLRQVRLEEVEGLDVLRLAALLTAEDEKAPDPSTSTTTSSSSSSSSSGSSDDTLAGGSNSSNMNVTSTSTSASEAGLSLDVEFLCARRCDIDSAEGEELLRALLRRRDGRPPRWLNLELNRIGDAGLRGLPGVLAYAASGGSSSGSSSGSGGSGESSLRSSGSSGSGSSGSGSSGGGSSGGGEGRPTSGGDGGGAANAHARRELEELNLRRNGITLKGARSLASALARVPGAAAGLRRLYLGGNGGIGDECAAALAVALGREGVAPHLECLELRDCGIGDEGAAALAEHVLRRHPRLSRLDLGRNPKITARGAEAISRALCVPHCRLAALDLRHCKVEDGGAAAFAAAVGSGHARRLRALHLGANGIGPKGARLLARGLGHLAQNPRDQPSRTTTAATPPTATNPATAMTSGASLSYPDDDDDDDDDDVDVDVDVALLDDAPDGLVYLDLSGNQIEGKAKANEKVKAKISKTLGKVSGLMGKVSSKIPMGGVGSTVGAVLGKGLSEADKQLFAPKTVPTKAGGSGALAKAIITPPPGGITLRRLGLAGCGLEKRHLRLLDKAADKAAAERAAFLGHAHSKVKDTIAASPPTPPPAATSAASATSATATAAATAAAAASAATAAAADDDTGLDFARGNSDRFRVAVETRLNLPVGRAAGETPGANEKKKKKKKEKRTPQEDEYGEESDGEGYDSYDGDGYAEDDEDEFEDEGGYDEDEDDEDEDDESEDEYGEEDQSNGNGYDSDDGNESSFYDDKSEEEEDYGDDVDPYDSDGDGGWQ